VLISADGPVCFQLPLLAAAVLLQHSRPTLFFAWPCWAPCSHCRSAISRPCCCCVERARVNFAMMVLTFPLSGRGRGLHSRLDGVCCQSRANLRTAGRLGLYRPPDILGTERRFSDQPRPFHAALRDPDSLHLACGRFRAISMKCSTRPGCGPVARFFPRHLAR